MSRSRAVMSTMSTTTSTPRNRTACSPCTRRKVKCSRTIPCNNCIRRGEQDACIIEVGSAAALPTPRLSQRPSPEDSAANRQQPHQGEIDYLRRRVAELEEQARRSPVGLSRYHSSPIEVAGMTPGEEQGPTRSPLTDQEATIVASTGDRPDTSDAVIKDAASILEFLAWGRRKDPEYRSVGLPDVNLATSGGSGDVHDLRQVDELVDPFEDCSKLAVIQLLLPSRRQVWQLVNYHHECLLWYHVSYYAPTFQNELESFYERYGGSVESPGVNLQWVALLFAVLTGSLTCAPVHKSRAWGFRDPERESLCKRWFQASNSCLNRAEYTANHSILSCQTISTMTISSHILGFSNTQSIQLAAAVRIAQSLGLHRLGPDAVGGTVEKEAGRRVWSQLCSQDWFGIPFSESYLINPLYSQSSLPANCHDHDLVALPAREPTITGYCRFLNTIASMMPQLQDGLLSCNTAYTRYEQVLTWDARLRTLATVERPIFLSSQVPIEPNWPRWIPWARRALAITSSHKIIMIHRSCLSESFTNPAFAFTRRTCLAASKTIIKEYKAVAREDGPILWVHQAFSVAASIILILDVLHRDPSEREYVEHKSLVEDIVGILLQCNNSMIATRGIKLLRALLDEVIRLAADDDDSALGQKRKRGDNDSFTSSTSGVPRKPSKFNVPAFVKLFCEGNVTSGQQQLPRHGRSNNPSEPPLVPSQDHSLATYGLENAQQVGDGGFPIGETPDDSYLFMPPGLEGANGFENLLYLASHDFTF